MSSSTTVTKGSAALAKFLKTHGLSYEIAAKALGCSKSSLFDICKGIHHPGVRVALRIERWTGIPCEHFATPEEMRELSRLRPYRAAA